jgi:L-amino acid N-acyltransferase YncA
MKHLSDISIIDVCGHHLEEIRRIYDYHVHHGNSSWEYSTPDLQEMENRYRAIKEKGFPYIAAVKDNIIAGYAYAGSFRSREGYKFTAENSVYVHKDHTGKGIGKLLLSTLIEKLAPTKIRSVIAVIGDSENTASIKLHESVGFVHCGTLPKIGFKNGEWLDSYLMVKKTAAPEN